MSKPPIGFVIVLFLALAASVSFGCRGSVDRVYDDEVGGGGILGDGTSSIGGTVTGLLGSGLVLQNNGGDDLPVLATGAFVFATRLDNGAAYDVSVKTQPTNPSQTCAVSRGSGTAGGGVDVSTVQLLCTTNAYRVGGAVTGLSSDGLVLQNNFGDDLPLGPADGGASFQFPTVIPSGSAYSVSVKTQPVADTCSVTSGTGQGTVADGDVTSVVVACTPGKGPGTVGIGGTVTGLVGTLVLQNNLEDDLTLSAPGFFSFSKSLVTGAAYSVTVKTPPSYPPRQQQCVVANGTGTAATTNVVNVTVTCTTDAFTVGGSVTDLSGTLTLQNNLAEIKSLTSNAPFAFATPVLSGDPYSVTIKTQPAGQSCHITNPSGTMATANVTNVSASCFTAVAFSENFDGVTAPNLPNGWTSVNALTGSKSWATNSTAFATGDPVSDSGANSAFFPQFSTPSDVALVSPQFTVLSSFAQVTFRHSFSFEFVSGFDGFDGGVLEIAIANGAFQDIQAAGGSFVTGGYNAKLATVWQNPLGGRDAWSNCSGSGTPCTGGFITTTAKLPASAAGNKVQLRWRIGYDKQTYGTWYGWRIDSVVVRN